MNLKECRETYYEDTRKVSELVRYLAFAGIALIWIFRKENNGVYSIPGELILPAILLMVGLGLDLLHAISRALTWGIYSRFKERSGISEEKCFNAPPWINLPAIFFFGGKIIVVMISYVLIVKFLINTMCFFSALS